jgi:hypothetical protein
MKIPVLSRIAEWSKYGDLHHYPALQAFSRDEALKRLTAYEREERAACQPWLRIVYILYSAMWLVFMVLLVCRVPFKHLNACLLIPTWAVPYVMHRRIRRRVEAKVAAELKDGRLWTCIECGYDLRASPGPLCPECGTDFRLPGATNASKEVVRSTAPAASGPVGPEPQRGDSTIA